MDLHCLFALATQDEARMEKRQDSLVGLLRFKNGSPGPIERATHEEAALGARLRLGRAEIITALAILFAIAARFYGLAEKPLHHDESLFAYYSYFLAQGYGYQYQPILHGPILEHVTALIFLLFGDSDFTMRLPAAIGSLGLFAALWGWRRYLGDRGALVALVLLALSPSITYYSRFLRNDAPYLAATFWCGYALLRAFETGERRYFWQAGLAATIMFCMMESSIFFFAACVGYLGVAIVTDWLCFRRARGTARQFPGSAVFFTPTVVEESRSAFRRDLQALAVSLIIGMLVAVIIDYLYVRVLSDSLPLPGWKRLDDGWEPSLVGRMIEVYPLFMALIVPLALLAGVNWNSPRGERGTLYYVLRVCWHRRWTLLAIFAASVAIYTTLFTTYFSHMSGPDFFGKVSKWTPLQIYKNTWDYWWDQHQQHRIKGPFHYHIPIILLYEWPVVLLAVIGAWASLRSQKRSVHLAALLFPQLLLLAFGLAGGFKNWDWEAIDRRWHVSHPFHVALALFYVQILTHYCGVLISRGRFAEAFLAFWTVTSLFAYSYAGEKVPWLSIHVTGPLILWAALHLGHWLEVSPQRALRWWFVAASSFVVLWQLRSVAFVAWVHPASPAERIVYNHTTSDVVLAVKRIEELAHDSQLGASLPMYIKGEMEWPLYWYLRRFSNWGPSVQEDPAETSRPVVLVNWESVPDIPYLSTDYEMMRLKVREWWEPPLLDFTALTDVWRLLTPRESRRDSENGRRLRASLEEWRKLWRYLVHREIWLDPTMPGFSNGANEFAFCVSKKFLEDIRSHQWLTARPMRRDVRVSGPSFGQSPQQE